MDTHSMIAREIEAVAPSTSSAARNDDNDSWCCPTAETAEPTKTHWLVDAVLLAVAAGATLYGGIWWDPTTFPN